MSEIWYRCRKYSDDKIEAVKVIKSSEKTIVVREKALLGERFSDVRSNINSEWAHHFRTWKEAHDYLLTKAEHKVDELRVSLERAKGSLGNIRGMKEPTSHEP
jgi:hypothetical protein